MTITYCIGMEDTGRADSAVRGIVSVSMGLVGKVIFSHGTEEQKLEWRTADLIELGELFGTEASMAKYFCSEAAVRAAKQRDPAVRWRRAASMSIRSASTCAMPG